MVKMYFPAGPLAVIVEYAPNGNLRDFLQKRKSCWEYEVPYGSSDKSETGKLSLKKLINYGYQVSACCHGFKSQPLF